MDFQAYNKILICEDHIRNIVLDNQVIGYEFKIKYPSYRGAFLSCIEDLRFQIDGQWVAKENVVLTVNGKDFLIDELPECFKEYWFVREKGTVRIRDDQGLLPGQHQVRVYMKHRVPYTGYFGQYLVLESDVTETRMAEQR